jgi:hypothetical protein
MQKRRVVHPSATPKRLRVPANLAVTNSIVLSALQPPIQFSETMTTVPCSAPLHDCIWIRRFETSETVLGPGNERNKQRIEISVAAKTWNYLCHVQKLHKRDG